MIKNESEKYHSYLINGCKMAYTQFLQMKILEEVNNSICYRNYLLSCGISEFKCKQTDKGVRCIIYYL